MEERPPRIGEFVSTHARGLVEIAHVDPEQVYLNDTPNRPIPISTLMPSPDQRHDVWVIVHDAAATKFRPDLNSTAV
jgi:hypothetical protein